MLFRSKLICGHARCKELLQCIGHDHRSILSSDFGSIPDPEGNLRLCYNRGDAPAFLSRPHFRGRCRRAYSRRNRDHRSPRTKPTLLIDGGFTPFCREIHLLNRLNVSLQPVIRSGCSSSMAARRDDFSNTAHHQRGDRIRINFACLFIGLDRKWLACGQSDAIDPHRTSAHERRC